MNYYRARQRKDGRWDYTCKNDDFIYPIGYCHEHKEPDSNFWPEHADEKAIREATKHKFHDTGHATEDEACECYREYLLDHHMHLMKKHNDTQHHCKVCGQWTEYYAEVDMNFWNLCELHNNKKEVEKLFESPGQVWSS